MCLSIPSKVVSLDEDNMATVDTLGVKRVVSLDLMPESVNVGDYVLIHIGYAINKIDEESALASIETFKEIIAQMDEEERREAIGE
ncbi:MAG: HypC/HybG/HupF family hydrogenase formation chaperone [Campylobacteraceae bacterium]|jgi:hydrogenase expression/formation protein HypC|nr:HypC/HybG/HupF family hydrogenase formation chaperone [Campylobacteraceae bacterium]